MRKNMAVGIGAPGSVTTAKNV